MLQFNRLMPAEEVGATIAAQFEAGARYIHAAGLPFAEFEPDAQVDYVRRASQAIGKVTLSTEAPDSDVWCLDRFTSPSINPIPFHTDNPFYHTPERIVGFWCVRSAPPPGGNNLLLAVDDLLDYGVSTPVGRALIDELGNTPVTFTDGKEHSATAPVLDLAAATVRFSRNHVVQKDAKLAGRFGALLETDIKYLGGTVHLWPGEALIFDNHRMLHARSSYSNLERLSLRTRILDLPTACAM